MRWWRRLTGEVWLSFLTAVALLVQAVIARNVIDVELDFISQFAALWVFIAFLVGGGRSRTALVATATVIVLVTVAILALYAL